LASIYLKGNTIRVQATFADFDGNATDPEVIKFITYDNKYTKLSEITLSSANKVDTGIYYYDYTIPNNVGKSYYYEFYGEIGGNPTLNRREFSAKFV